MLLNESREVQHCYHTTWTDLNEEKNSETVLSELIFLLPAETRVGKKTNIHLALVVLGVRRPSAPCALHSGNYGRIGEHFWNGLHSNEQALDEDRDNEHELVRANAVKADYLEA